MNNKDIWAAGFMDGEGTITIKRYFRYGRMRYQPYVSCTQVQKPRNIEAIDLLKELYGGSISKWESQTPKGDRIASYSWAVVSQDALKCLIRLLPYLMVKCDQAKLIIDYYKTIEKSVGSTKLKPEEDAKREEIFWKMRAFNVKGKIRLQRLSEVAPQGDAIV